MSCDSFCKRRLTSKTSVAMIITLKVAGQITAVKCTLNDRDGNAAGDPVITDADGEFLNSTNGITADTIWTVSYPDFDPSELGLEKDLYTMRFNATVPGDDDQVGRLGIRITS